MELLAQLVNRALNVAELILKDEKYRRVVASTPELINRVLALLEKLNTTENQKLVLRVIAALGDSTDSKLEIGRRTGGAVFHDYVGFQQAGADAHIAGPWLTVAASDRAA